jgi:hypothetical protein
VPPSPLGFSFCLKDALVASFPSFLSLPPPFHPAKRCGSSAMPAPTRTTSEIRGSPTCTKDSKKFQKMPRPGLPAVRGLGSESLKARSSALTAWLRATREGAWPLMIVLPTPLLAD